LRTVIIAQIANEEEVGDVEEIAFALTEQCRFFERRAITSAKNAGDCARNRI